MRPWIARTLYRLSVQRCADPRNRIVRHDAAAAGAHRAHGRPGLRDARERRAALDPLGDVEVLRGIAFLVRDRNWDTPPPQISESRRIDQTRARLPRHLQGAVPHRRRRTAVVGGDRRRGGRHVAVRRHRQRRPRTSSPTAPASSSCIRSSAWSAARSTSRMSTARKRRARFPDFVDPEQCFIDVRALSPSKSRRASGRPARWRATPGRWRIIATGSMRPSRPMCARCALPYPYTIEGRQQRHADGDARLLRGDAEGDATAAAERRSRSRSGARRDAHARDRPARAAAMDGRGASPRVELVRQAGPQLINGRIDPRAGHGVKEMKALGALAAAVGAGLTLEAGRALPPRSVGGTGRVRRRSCGSRACVRNRSRWPRPRIASALEPGTAAAAARAAGRDLPGGARGAARRRDRRRHVRLLHRAQSQLAADRTDRLHRAHGLQRRPRSRRPGDDGEPRVLPAHRPARSGRLPATCPIA